MTTRDLRSDSRGGTTTYDDGAKSSRCLHHNKDKPLTPALSPEYGGEGEQAFTADASYTPGYNAATDTLLQPNAVRQTPRLDSLVLVVPRAANGGSSRLRRVR